ncbi:MAG: hypothetical protein LBM16_03340 [Clostridiales bacterium]|jgi:hypothetical protein|nr:hypothetical protein [Clostridiales bacterium]
MTENRNLTMCESTRENPLYGNIENQIYPPMSNVSKLPPIYAPSEQNSHAFIGANSMRSCLGNYAYVWLKSGESFWLYVTYIGRQSIYGYKWTYFGWAYSAVNVFMIRRFFCAK